MTAKAQLQAPIDAIRLLGDLLEEKEEECFDERDRVALQGLWEVYEWLLEP